MSDIDFCDNKIFVVVNGSPGVVSNSGTKLYCCVCDSVYCSHCMHIKKLRKDSSQPDFIVDFFKEAPHSEKSLWKHSDSHKMIPFDVEVSETLQPPSTYLVKQDNFFQCQDEDTQCCLCDGPLEVVCKNERKLVCKNYFVECEGNGIF